ncbi:MAG: ATP-binding cassette domain-containing protein, partial [Betaproteobacteria bacterium]|nr:ATP-binding cassette domain-containing protein [Betaproteobacteria bacterium]
MADAVNTVEITALSKVYADGNQQVLALKGVSLGIPEGMIYTFLGPSGCGKTTTLRCVAGLERPDAGTISIAGSTVFSSAERIHVPPNRRPIGMVFQSYAVWPHMTVFENVAYPLAVRGRARGEIKRRVVE